MFPESWAKSVPGGTLVAFESGIGVGPAMETNQDHDSRATLSGVASSRIKRRAVLHAGWTVPVVLAVTAAPALAVSQPIHVTSVAGSCKLPGNSCHPATPKGYRMVLTITANQA